MNNLIESAQALIFRALEQCVSNQGGISFRYEYFSSERLHVVEVYPDYFYDFETIESLEEGLLDDICNFDLSQGLLFVKESSESYKVTNPDFEISSDQVNGAELVGYAEKNLEYVVTAEWFNVTTSQNSNYALAA